MEAGSISLSLNRGGPLALPAWVESARLGCRWRPLEDEGRAARLTNREEGADVVVGYRMLAC